MSSEPVDIWSVDAHRLTLNDAAEQFARSYWKEPRKLKAKPTADGRFQMVGGWQTYRIRLDKTCNTPAQFIVERCPHDS